MTIQYIFHSGFLIETDNCILVFDYWMDPTGVMAEALQKAKPLYVFASHFHEDHFSSDIFEWREQHTQAPCLFILSKDILKHRRAHKEDADVWLAKGGKWSDDNITVVATGSTDSGVSWVVKVEDRCIFHAGDLNNWYARFLNDNYNGGTIMSEEFGEVNPEKEEKAYLGELKDIRKVADHFDIAMFPVDGRIGNGYTRGARQFIDNFHVGLFIPMHFVASGFESAWRMKEFTDAAAIDFWRIAGEGEKIKIC